MNVTNHLMKQNKYVYDETLLHYLFLFVCFLPVFFMSEMYLKVRNDQLNRGNMVGVLLSFIKH